jgi:heme/copper-type cytochrome/quinol oxidase subunit 2
VQLNTLSLNTLLSIIILVSFIVTVVLAAASYAAYKLRERRRPKPAAGTESENLYFERYFPPAPGRGPEGPPG